MRVMLPRLACFAALVAVGASAAHADPPPLVTDRPGNGNASSSVPRGHLQIEASTNYVSAAGDVQLISFPTLLRYGVLDFAELRVSSGLVGINTTSGSDEDPVLTDTSVGAKVQVADGAGWTPQLSLMVDVFLETGDGAFTNGTTVPDARVAASWGLPANFGLLLNTGINLPGAGDNRFAQLLYIANLGYVPAGLLGGKLGVFVELYGQQPFDSDQAKTVQLDLGAAYAITPTLQVDFYTQHGLSDAAPDFQLSVGLSTRL